MRHPLVLSFVAAAALSGCQADLAVPSDASIRCASSDDCPPDFVCNPNTAMCISAENPDTSLPQVVPPLMVTPNNAGLSTVIVAALEVSEPLSEPPRLYFDDGGVEREFVVDPGSAGTSWTLTYTPTGEETQDAPMGLRIRLVDLAGNTLSSQLGQVVRFDFTLPEVNDPSLRLVPENDNPLFLVSLFAGAHVVSDLAAAKPGTDVIVQFSTSEPVEPPQVVAIQGGTEVAASLRSKVGNHYVFGAAVPGNAIEGDYDLVIRLRDLAGNEQVSTQPAALSIMTMPPPAPAVGEPQAVRYARAPWGEIGTTEQGAFTVEGAAGAATEGAYVVALAGATLSSTPLGAALADSLGAFSVELARVDRHEVRVVTVDAAGNASPVVRVRDVEWVASLGRKVAGSTVDNPSSLSATTRFSPTLEQAGALEANGGAAFLGVGCDGNCLSTLGQGYWRAGRNSATDVNILVPSPSVFTARAGMAVAYYPPRGSVIAFGGSLDAFGSAVSAETWEWNGASWRQLDVSGPSARYEAAMVYDENLGQIILFGGASPTATAECPLAQAQACNDRWAFNGASWSALTVSGTAPTHRSGHAMAYDRTRGRTVIFGGASGITKLADTYELNCGASSCASALVAGAGPSARNQAAMTYDPQRGGLVLFAGSEAWGGGGPCGDAACEDLWQRVGTTWSRITTSTGLFRRGSRLTYDVATGEVLGFGVDNLFYLQEDPIACGRPWRLGAGSFRCPGSAAPFGVRDVTESAGTSMVYVAAREETLVIGRDLDGVEHRWVGGARDRPAHVFYAALGQALGGDSALIDRVSFAPAASPADPGFRTDTGEAFGARGDGRSYGWLQDGGCDVAGGDPALFDRNSSAAPSQALDTVARMQEPNQIAPDWRCTWEYALDNGTYMVVAAAGDPTLQGAVELEVEGVALTGETSEDAPWLFTPVQVTVTDGRLTVANGPSQGLRNHLAYVEIFRPAEVDEVSVRWSAGGGGQSYTPAHDVRVYQTSCSIGTTTLTITADEDTAAEGGVSLAELVGESPNRAWELAVHAGDSSAFSTTPTWTSWCLTFADQPSSPICRSVNRTLAAGVGRSDIMNVSGRPAITGVTLAVSFSNSSNNYFCNNGARIQLRASPVPGAPAAGVGLYGYDAGAWRLLATGDSGPASPDLVEWTSSSPGEAALLIAGASRVMAFAVAPLAGNGALDTGAAITTDALEVRVRYHLTE